MIPLYLYSVEYQEPYDDGIISTDNLAFVADTSDYEYAYSISLSQEECENLKRLLIDHLGNIESLVYIYDVNDQVYSPRVILYD